MRVQINISNGWSMKLAHFCLLDSDRSCSALVLFYSIDKRCFSTRTRLVSLSIHKKWSSLLHPQRNFHSFSFIVDILRQAVPEPIVELLDGQGAVLLPDTVLYYRIGSSLDLHCRVRRYWIKPKRFSWLKSGRPLTDDIWRGGIR